MILGGRGGFLYIVRATKPWERGHPPTLITLAAAIGVRWEGGWLVLPLPKP
jgi:hypothetical protein